MEVEKMYMLCKAISMLEEVRSMYETKRVYDYMETCALEKVRKDILNGKRSDWTAIDNIYLLVEDLMQRLDRLTSEGQTFLKDALEIL